MTEESAYPELYSTFQLYKKKMTSFGEYFDNQHAAIVKAMQDKNKQLNVEWMERYEKRQKEKQAYQIIEEINDAQI